MLLGFDKTIKQLITQKIYDTSIRYAFAGASFKAGRVEYFSIYNFLELPKSIIFMKATIPCTHNSNSIFILIAIMHGEKNLRLILSFFIQMGLLLVAHSQSSQMLYEAFKKKKQNPQKCANFGREMGCV